jgi:signal transduction histidine kinase
VKERTAATAGRRLVVIFVALLAAGLTIAGMSLREMGETSRSLEAVLSRHAENLLQVERLSLVSERLGRLARSYLLTGEPPFIEELDRSRSQFTTIVERLSVQLDTDEARHILEVARQVEDEHERAVDRAITLRRQRSAPLAILAGLEGEVRHTRERLDVALSALADGERHEFDRARADATHQARTSFRLLVVAAVGALLLAVALAWALARTLAGLSRSRAELDASMAKLERANRDLDAFAGRIAHDLRNILAPLPLTAAHLRHHHEPAVVAGSADKIERIARRAEGLMEALLAFARAGQPPESSATASVSRVVQEALDDLAHLRSLVDAQVSLDIQDLQVRCAPSLLGTVMTNLLGNAFKFVEGRPRREVRVCARQEGALCEISVADTGPGLSEKTQPRIFEPFYRAPDAKGSGSGIGLATVQRIVEAYDGRVTVRSRPGEGATFLIRLPLAEPPPVRTPVPVVAEQQPAVH